MMAAHLLRRFVRWQIYENRRINRVFAANLRLKSGGGGAGNEDEKGDDARQVVGAPRRVFSGIQPTGTLHLGNYFGAVSQWVKMQDEDQDTIVSIVDLHSITFPQNSADLRDNIFKMAACLLACGIDPDKVTLFRQSRVRHHLDLAWVLGGFSTMARLGRLPQYKEKSSKLKEIPLNLFSYPVLQSADILLYKATHVPVGEDQLQHVQLAQHLARVFNNTHGPYFPTPKAILGDDTTSRLKSLRDPAKKMSKSDADPRSRIELLDSDEVVAEKLKKAITDFTSEVTYDPEGRPAVSNLVSIECLLTGKTPRTVCEENRGATTAQYKLRLAEVAVSALRPIRRRAEDLMANRDHLERVLQAGAEKAARAAEETWRDVERMTGLS